MSDGKGVDDLLAETGRGLARLRRGRDSPEAMTPLLRSDVAGVMTALLRREHADWRWETIDGVDLNVENTLETDAMCLIGVAVLTADQCITPVALDLTYHPDSQTVHTCRLRLGERGEGALGISGPAFGSSAASTFRMLLPDRIDAVRWVYDIAVRLRTDAIARTRRARD